MSAFRKEDISGIIVVQKTTGVFPDIVNLPIPLDAHIKGLIIAKNLLKVASESEGLPTDLTDVLVHSESEIPFRVFSYLVTTDYENNGVILNYIGEYATVEESIAENG